MTATYCNSSSNVTTDTPYLTLKGELWGVNCDDFWTKLTVSKLHQTVRAYRWVSSRKTQLQCEHTRATSFPHQPIDIHMYTHWRQISKAAKLACKLLILTRRREKKITKIPSLYLMINSCWNRFLEIIVTVQHNMRINLMVIIHVRINVNLGTIMSIRVEFNCGLVDLRKWAIFNTILTSSKSWLSQKDLDAGCEHSLVPMHSRGF